MHAEALLYVSDFRTDDRLRVIEFGSRDINGSPRYMFPNADYHGIDVVDGTGVDEVADAATWAPKRRAHLVICCEVFEHTKQWRKIVANAAACLVRGGRLVVTAAGPQRAPHSAVDGGSLRDGEWYENVSPADLGAAMVKAGFKDVEVHERGGDVQGTGVKK